MRNLTDRELQKALRDAKRSGSDVLLTDASKARRTGRLRFRARPAGQGIFYFRYFDSTGKQGAISLGVYDETGRGGLSLRKARDKAGELSKLYQGGTHDLRAHLVSQAAEERSRREREAREREYAERMAQGGSLAALLEGYTAHLQRQGKQSWRDAQNHLRRNVLEAFSDLAKARAADITLEDVNAILSRLIERGAGRTAGKVRSYLRAAFALAMQAGSDPTVPPALHGFNLTRNPAALVPAKALAQFNIARDRDLSESELRAYMAALDRLPAGAIADALWLCLLLGGQRPAQLLRVRPADVDLDARTITLYDTKGARKQPRAHRLPLPERAAEIVARLIGNNGEAPYLLSSAGTVPVRVETISHVVAEISRELLEAKRIRAPFQQRDIRRTCETMLAAMGVSKDIRAQILSHGLGGVQDRHYDRHDYMDEKRRALEAWEARIAEIASGMPRRKVVALAQRTAA